jgi:ferredoxin-NADP reductase
VQAPGGHFTLDPASREPVVLVAGGIGITPVLSMLKATLLAAPEREIWLFYAVRNGAEIAMKEELRQLARTHPGLRLRVCFSRPGADDVEAVDFHHRGRLDVTHLRMDLPLREFHFYVCGPGPMMESLLPAIEAWGVPPDRLHYEAFGPASLSRQALPGTPVPSAGTVDVTFGRSNKRLAWDGRAESLLEFAERNGIGVDCGCRAGGCGSCQTRIVSGEVTYTRTPDFDPAPGHCLLCVSVPKSTLALEL